MIPWEGYWLEFWASNSSWTKSILPIMSYSSHCCILMLIYCTNAPLTPQNLFTNKKKQKFSNQSVCRFNRFLQYLLGTTFGNTFYFIIYYCNTKKTEQKSHKTETNNYRQREI